jgi:hypothetical protein
MKSILIILLFFTISFIIRSQDVADHPDLGLHGTVTWLSDSTIRVEYDWSHDSMLLDWSPTKGSKLVLRNNTVTITGGLASVRSMEWKQLIRCSRIYVQDAKAINSSNPHLNFITNVLGWTGYDFNPPEIIGLLYKSNGNLWLENEASEVFPGPSIVLGNKYTIDINISSSAITTQSSINNVVYTRNLTNPPDMERQVAVGGWGGDTEWGKLIIEGEIAPVPAIPEDMIVINTIGADFAPVIEVAGTPVIEWVFNDSTTSSSATPSKSYGSLGLRRNYLKVTPWSALIGINVGYDAGDGGYGNFALVENQNVSGFSNLAIAGNLQYICTSHNPLEELDLRGLTALRFIESLYCPNLKSAKLGTHPELERICFENCNLDSLDLSGCSALEDLRASRNNYTTIKWGDAGPALWHICVRSNQLAENLPDLTQFPVLRELLTWENNQTGAFVCHSPVIRRIDSYDNHYTSADVSGCTELRELSLSGSQLDALDLGTADRIDYLRLTDCGLEASQVDYVLKTLDLSGITDGYVELEENEGPTAESNVHLTNLKSKGWTVKTEAVTGIPGISDDENLKVIVKHGEIMIPLEDDYLTWKAGIYNIQGKLLISRIVENDNLVFDTSTLSPGIYIIVLSKDDYRVTAKVSLR